MTKKTTRTRAEAKKLMWEYYRNNKDLLPKKIREFREEIIFDMTVGGDAKIVFSKFLD
jgi:hypothetical protein